MKSTESVVESTGSAAPIDRIGYRIDRIGYFLNSVSIALFAGIFSGSNAKSDGCQG